VGSLISSACLWLWRFSRRSARRIAQRLAHYYYLTTAFPTVHVRIARRMVRPTARWIAGRLTHYVCSKTAFPTVRVPYCSSNGVSDRAADRSPAGSPFPFDYSFAGEERGFFAGCSQARKKRRKEEGVEAALLSSTHWIRTRYGSHRRKPRKRRKRNRRKVGKELLYFSIQLSTTKTMKRKKEKN